MEKVNQPHDKYFRSTFGRVDFAKVFLSNYLPEELIKMVDMDTLTPQTTNYMSKELKEQFIDLLFRVNIDNKEAYICFLFEHKSYPDRMVIFQVLKYMIEIWEAKIKKDLEDRRNEMITNSYDTEIPIVIPLVVYHNKEKWNVKRTLGEMIPNFYNLPDEIIKYIPDFKYMLSDLSSDSEVNLDEEHSIVIRTLNYARYASKDELLDIFTEAITIFTKNKDRDMVNHYIVETIIYILSARDDLDKEELFKIAGQISIEGGELVMSVAEQLRQEGMEEGAKKERIKFAKDMMRNNEPIEKIVQYTKLSKGEIDIIRLQMDN